MTPQTLRLALRLIVADTCVGVCVRVLGLAQFTAVEYTLRTLALACVLQRHISEQQR
jgi:hypothetical protein